MSKEISRSFPQVLTRTQVSNRNESRAACDAAAPGEKANTLILRRRVRLGIVDQTQWGFRRIMRRQLSGSGRNCGLGILPREFWLEAKATSNPWPRFQTCLVRIL